MQIQYCDRSLAENWTFEMIFFFFTRIPPMRIQYCDRSLAGNWTFETDLFFALKLYVS